MNRLDLFGYIGDRADPNSVFLRDIVRALDQSPGEGLLLVCIRSSGGDANEGLAIHAALRASGKRILVRIQGFAHSAAAVVAMAGHRVEIESDATLLIHSAFSFVSGTPESLSAAGANADSLNLAQAEVFASKTGRSVAEELSRIHAGEALYSAQDAVREGYADGVFKLHVV